MVANDLKDIDKDLTYREMFKKILHMIEADREDRAEDRELLEKFVTTQGDFNKAIDQRVRSLEDGGIATNKDLERLKESSKKWDTTNSIGALIALLASILAALGLTGS